MAEVEAEDPACTRVISAKQSFMYSRRIYIMSLSFCPKGKTVYTLQCVHTEKQNEGERVREREGERERERESRRHKCFLNRRSQKCTA